MKNNEKNTGQRNLNRDIHKQAVNERFPESSMTKDQRKDAEKVKGSRELGNDEPGSDLMNTPDEEFGSA